MEEFPVFWDSGFNQINEQSIEFLKCANTITFIEIFIEFLKKCSKFITKYWLTMILHWLSGMPKNACQCGIQLPKRNVHGLKLSVVVNYMLMYLKCLSKE